jgi:hypothetical protein
MTERNQSDGQTIDLQGGGSADSQPKSWPVLRRQPVPVDHFSLDLRPMPIAPPASPAVTVKSTDESLVVPTAKAVAPLVAW